MADKRIHELVTTTDKTSKFIALDEAGLSEAQKFSADSLIDQALTDTLYVKLIGNETVAGTKTWSNIGIFSSGIDVTAGGLTVAGNVDFTGGTLSVAGQIIVTVGGIDVTGNSSIAGTLLVAGTLTVSTGGILVTGNSSITGTLGVTSTLTVSAGGLIVSAGGINVTGNSTFNDDLTISGGDFILAGASDQVSIRSSSLTGDTQIFTINMNNSYAAWVDFPTGLPAQRALYLAKDAATYGSNDYNGIFLQARGNSSDSSFGIIALQAVSTTEESRFNFMLRGTSTTDYRTILTLTPTEIIIRAETTSLDIVIRLVQSNTTQITFGWDDGTNSFQIAHGNAFGGTARYEFRSNNFYMYGSSSASLYIDAATTNASIYLQADSTDDAVIYFRQNTTTKFIVGYDDTYDNFQIHSSTSFTSVPDFCVDTSGNIGIGTDASTTIRLHVEKSYSSLTLLCHFESQGNTANAAGIKIQSGLDTPTTTACITLQAADGNGSLVGQHQFNTTSGYNIWNALSSAAYKKNIQPATLNATELLKQIQPKKYNWKGRTPAEEIEITNLGEDTIEMFGFLIEDIEPVIPQAVTLLTDAVSHETRKAYSDGVLVRYLVKAIDELSARLDILEP